MDKAPALRDAYSADLVSMIEESSRYCDISYQMTSASSTFEDQAFSVVASQCATGYYSFGHELGHTTGLSHDRLDAAGPGARLRSDYAARGCPGRDSDTAGGRYTDRAPERSAGGSG